MKELCVGSHRLATILWMLLMIIVPTAVTASDGGPDIYQLSGTQERLADSSDAYCAYVEGIAASQRALLVSPDLIASTGLAFSSTPSTGEDDLEPEYNISPTMRVTAGLQYRFSNLYKGALRSQDASARCTRYRAQVGLRTVVELGKDLGRRQAVEAQLEVLQDALPRAEQAVALAKRGLDVNFSTIEDVLSVKLKLDGLRRLVGTLEADLERLAEMPDPGERSLDELMRAYEVSDDAVGALEARLRRSTAWVADVRGGYDQLLAYPRDYPLFFQVRFSYNLGTLAQKAAERRSAAGRRLWRSTADETLSRRTELLRIELAHLVQKERRRLAEISPLLMEVQHRLETLAAVDTMLAEKTREDLWLDFVRLDGERTYLEVHIASVETILGLASSRLESGESNGFGQSTQGTRSTDGLRIAVAHGDAGNIVLSSDSGMTSSPSEMAPPTLQSVSLADLHITNGSVTEMGDGQLQILRGIVRGVTRHTGYRAAGLHFTYLGHTPKRTPLGSGVVRHQLGLKLSAENTCNLLYVMWEIEPRSQLVVSRKENPGQCMHIQCRNRGYQRLGAVAMAPIRVGEPHELSARADPGRLQVWVDGSMVWNGALELGAAPDGRSVGIRTDNVKVAFRFEVGE